MLQVFGENLPLITIRFIYPLFARTLVKNTENEAGYYQKASVCSLFFPHTFFLTKHALPLHPFLMVYVV